MAQKLGRSSCKTPGQEEGYGRVGPPDLGHRASHVGRRHDVPDGGRANDLIRNPLPA